uniref:HIT domain-containing protein n=1 Tax=candidate division WOR-3 bacterium TaxID=2052148 RepID=A0A7V3ZU36_UNCW3
MDNLFAPWRMEYIGKEQKDRCIFCDILKENNDEKNYVLIRSTYAFCLLNRYPYNNGHLMVVSNFHQKELEEFKKEEVLDIFYLLTLSLQVLKKVLKPAGFNIGVNLGEVAGAGVKDHFHLHIVPRWLGDTNFMPLLAETKVISEHLRTTYEKLLPYFRKEEKEK